MKRLLLPLLPLVAIVFSSCDPFENNQTTESKISLPDIPFNYQVPGTNDHLPTLGRVLFYDPRLSINNSVSCSSCHKQALAFSDNASFSKGFENKLTTRNSMPIQNIISNGFIVGNNPTDSIVIINTENVGTYLPGVQVPDQFFIKPTQLFWDGREEDLQIMVTRPITNHVEMGIHDMNELANKLSQIEDYKNLTMKAFGKNDLSSNDIASALSAFLLSIRSTNSKFDQVVSSQNPQSPSSFQLSAIEEQGRMLFFDKFNCNNCHELNGFADIGLNAQVNDIGFAAFTGFSNDRGKFKIPSLRNVELTAPYMHDGRFATLDQVLNHYSKGIQNTENLDMRLRAADGTPLRMNMTESEKQAIIAFLKTLTDFTLVSDPKFSNPFVNK